MKPFQTLLLLTVLILIGGIAALYWGKSFQEATAPVAVEPSTSLVVENPQEALAPGAYLVFQVDDWFFYRLAVDDIPTLASGGNIGTADATPFATLKNPLSVSGGLTAYVYGQELLLHRYLDDEQDGILSLKGEIVETRAKNWEKFRSPNGRYEVRYEFGLESPSVDFGTFEVREVSTGELVSQHTVTLNSGEIGNPEPFMIDNLGEHLYVHQVCGCEATLAGLWEVDVSTGDSIRLDTLVDLDSWFLSSLNAQSRRLLTISTVRQQSEDGPYDELLPPTTIRILDLESLETEGLLVDEARAWDRPWLDPQGNDRYIVRLWGEGNKLYLVNFDDTEITDDLFLTDGWVLDWVGDWVAVQNNQDSTLKLVNVETKEEVTLEIPGERVEYVGSIELE